MINMKAAYESLGPHSSLDGLVVGTRLSAPGVRVVRQPLHATFVIYAVPDDAAVRFDCESRLTLEDPDSVARASTATTPARRSTSPDSATTRRAAVVQEDGYWKIVPWNVGAEDEKAPAPEQAPEAKVARINADPTFVEAARGFLENCSSRRTTTPRLDISPRRVMSATTSRSGKGNLPRRRPMRPAGSFGLRWSTENGQHIAKARSHALLFIQRPR